MTGPAVVRIGVLMALTLAAATLPAEAQDCQATWDRLTSLIAPPGDGIGVRGTLQSGQVDGECKVTGLRVPIVPGIAIAARGLSWSGQGLDRFTESGLPPDSLRLSVNDLRTETDPAPHIQYLTAGRMRAPVDIVLTWSWDAAERTLRLDTRAGGDAAEPSVWIDAEIDNLDFSSKTAMRLSSATFSVRRWRSDLNLSGPVERLVLLALAADRLDGADAPAQHAGELKSDLLAAIDALPDAVFSAPTRSAFRDAASGLPRPTGRLQIDLTAAPGIGPARFLASALSAGSLSLADISSKADGVQVSAVYER